MKSTVFLVIAVFAIVITTIVKLDLFKDAKPVVTVEPVVKEEVQNTVVVPEIKVVRSKNSSSGKTARKSGFG